MFISFQIINPSNYQTSLIIYKAIDGVDWSPFLTGSNHLICFSSTDHTKKNSEPMNFTMLSLGKIKLKKKNIYAVLITYIQQQERSIWTLTEIFMPYKHLIYMYAGDVFCYKSKNS